MIIEKEGIRRHVRAVVVDDAWTSLPEHCRQRHPIGCDHQPWPRRDDDRARFDDTTGYLDALDG